MGVSTSLDTNGTRGRCKSTDSGGSSPNGGGGPPAGWWRGTGGLRSARPHLPLHHASHDPPPRTGEDHQRPLPTPRQTRKDERRNRSPVRQSTAGRPARGTCAGVAAARRPRARRRRPTGPRERKTGRGRSAKKGQMSSSAPSSPGPTIISSATASVRPRIAVSSRCISSGFSVRKFFAFSRPCPIRIES